MATLYEYFQKLESAARPRGAIDSTITSYIDMKAPPMRLVENWAKFSKFDSCDFQFIFLPWCERRISHVDISIGHSILSGPFSGCYMAFVSGAGFTRGYHIHTENGPNDQKTNWNNHINFLSSEHQSLMGKIFKPIAGSILHGRMRHSFGLISPDGSCYSVLLSREKEEWRFEAIRQTPEEDCSRDRIPI